MLQRWIRGIGRSTLLIFLLLTSGCTGIAEGIDPVTDFDVKRYLGKWYEIARLDHSFERGLSHVSAEYSLRDDGKIRVLNKGYNTQKKQWQQAEGKAKFTSTADIGSLKVSFFGPFYGGYNIIALDKENYQYAMIAGNDRDYLWILSRTPELAPDVKKRLISQAAQLNFPIDKLIYVDQTPIQ